jgi:hypothetical protein
MLKSYCFFPRDLTTALSICEMEPFLSQTERAPLEVAGEKNCAKVSWRGYHPDS